jgi:16S rRNA (uracil1498-N3)-methyltransferase
LHRDQTDNVNLILFELSEIAASLPLHDPRANHILKVLRRKVGETFDAGIVNGPRGKGTLLAHGTEDLLLTFTWTTEPPPLHPITLIVGLPRPQTARKILQESTALGVAAIHFAATDKSDPSYGASTLWHTGEWRRHLLSGAEQAFCTRLPEVTHGRPLSEIIDNLPTAGTRAALDNYESSAALSQLEGITSHVALAIGPERGWSADERHHFRANRFTLSHLGKRVLRVETSCVAAIALIKARAKFW